MCSYLVYGKYSTVIASTFLFFFDILTESEKQERLQNRLMFASPLRQVIFRALECPCISSDKETRLTFTLRSCISIFLFPEAPQIC